MQTMMFFLDLFGVTVFAITGSIAAGRKRMDLLGVIVLAVVTALGGGTFRDLVLGTMPVFWVTAPTYVLVASVTALFVFFIVRFYSLPYKVLSVADAVGLSIFTVIGTQKAIDMETHIVIAIVMGVMTGVAGGMIRDILSGEIPLILKREIYATASLCGAITFSSIYILLQNQNLAIIASIVTTLGLRLSAIKWNLSLPLFTSCEEKS